MKRFMKQLWCAYRDYCPYVISITLSAVLIYFAVRPPTTETLLWWIAFILAWIFAIQVTQMGR